MAGFVEKAGALAPKRRLAVHCWRGGNRSQSMAWLLRMAGFDVVTLSGGYKTYRQHLLGALSRPTFQLRILGGPTGSGKTKILHAMRDLGAQIIDLEGLAHHKGSAFGSIGEPPQPSVEQFENELFDALSHLDPDIPVWIENESRSIGRVYIPDGFWNQMRQSPMVHVEVPDEARIRNLLEDYTHSDTDALRAAFMKIDTKLGGLNLKTAMNALDSGDFTAAAQIALWYYDKAYSHSLAQHPEALISKVVFNHGDPVLIARWLIEHSSHRAGDPGLFQTFPTT
jgi:tRNA 2-selenouridine synthase